jgi:hypothetical protein
MADIQTSEVDAKHQTLTILRRMQNMCQSTWDHEIVYAEKRPSKDEQLVI